MARSGGTTSQRAAAAAGAAAAAAMAAVPSLSPVAAAATATFAAAQAATAPTLLPLWTDHSIDSMREYERYRARCAAAGVPHTEWVYSRINTAQGTPHPDPDVRAPLPMYKLTTPPNSPPPQQQGQSPAVSVQLNVESYAKLLRGFPFPGGTQSVRRSVRAGQEHTNWGSTIGGGLQIARSLGDVNEKELHFLDATVSVGVHALDAEEDVTIVLGSDGFFDCFEYEQPVIMAHAHLRAGGRAACGLLLDQMLANTAMVNTETKRLCAQTLFEMRNGVPDWDDVSVAVLHVPARATAAQSACSNSPPRTRSLDEGINVVPE